MPWLEKPQPQFGQFGMQEQVLRDGFARVLEFRQELRQVLHEGFRGRGACPLTLARKKAPLPVRTNSAITKP